MDEITIVVKGMALKDLLLFLNSPRGERKMELAYNVCNGLYWDNPNLQALSMEHNKALKRIEEVFRKNAEEFKND